MAKTSGLTSFSCNTHTTLAVQDHQGGYHCYNCVIETYQTQVYHLARHILNDWALAEDAVQEGFTAGFRAFGKFRGDNLKAWITQIVVNVCRDMLRASKSRSAVSLDRLSEGPSQDNPGRGGMDFPSRDESPEEYAERKELRKAIEDGLSSLAEEQRLALALVDVQGMSYEETAGIMNCSLGTVKSRVSRGRSGLRDFLQSSGELLPSQFRQVK